MNDISLLLFAITSLGYHKIIENKILANILEYFLLIRVYFQLPYFELMIFIVFFIYNTIYFVVTFKPEVFV